MGHFGNRIKALRIAAGMTQDDLVASMNEESL